MQMEDIETKPQISSILESSRLPGTAATHESVPSLTSSDLPQDEMKVNTTNSAPSDGSFKEGTNIHCGTDGKRLCSFSKKLCLQRRMENYGFCIKHILEDPSAPFTQCQFTTKQTQKQCTNPVSNKEEPPRYCSAHRQILGIIPRKQRVKKAGNPNQKVSGKSQKKDGISDSSSEFVSPISSDLDEEDYYDGSDGDDFIYEDFVESSEALDALSVNIKSYGEGLSPEEEALLQRREKLIKLQTLYKLQFIRLRDKLRTKHRKFLKAQKKQLQRLVEAMTEESNNSTMAIEPPEKPTTGMSTSVSSSSTSGTATSDKGAALDHYQHFKHSKPRLVANAERKQKKLEEQDETKKTLKTCTSEDCQGKCLPLTEYCYAHIINDSRQRLFVPCSYVNSTNGVACKYPILVGQTPPYCNAHIDLVNPITKEVKTTTTTGRKRKSNQIHASNVGEDGAKTEGTTPTKKQTDTTAASKPKITGGGPLNSPGISRVNMPLAGSPILMSRPPGMIIGNIQYGGPPVILHQQHPNVSGMPKPMSTPINYSASAVFPMQSSSQSQSQSQSHPSHGGPASNSNPIPYPPFLNSAILLNPFHQSPSIIKEILKSNPAISQNIHASNASTSSNAPSNPNPNTVNTSQTPNTNNPNSSTSTPNNPPATAERKTTS